MSEEDELVNNIHEVCEIICNKGLSKVDETGHTANVVILAMMNLILQGVEQTERASSMDYVGKVFLNLIEQKKERMGKKDGDA